MNSKLNIQSLISDKNVCIVGGADNKIDPSFIQRADLTICINTHFARQGPLPNALFTSACEDLDYLDDLFFVLDFLSYDIDGPYASKYLQLSKDKTSTQFMGFCSQMFDGESPHGSSWEWTNSLYREIGTKPFSGVFAIYFCMLSDARSINVTGMDLHSSSDDLWTGLVQHPLTSCVEVCKQRGPHGLEPQARWLRDQNKFNARLRFDNFLSKAIESLLDKEL